MSRLGLDVQYNDRKIRKALRKLEKSGKSLKPVFQDIAEYLIPVHEDRWEREVDPDGNKWKELSAKTLKKKKTSRILWEEGDLLRGAVYKATTKSLSFGVSDFKVPFHQFGVDKNAPVKGHTRRITQAFGKELKFPVFTTVSPHSRHVQIPQRKILGLDDDDENEILDILSDYLLEAMSGK